MLTKTIKTNTWHYKFLTKFIGVRRYDRPRDRCSYVRAVIGYSLLTVVMTVIVTFMGVFFIGGTINAIGYAICYVLGLNGPFLDAPAIAFGLLACLVVVVLSIIYGIPYVFESIAIKNAERNELTEKTPGFFKMAWSSFKEKTCYRIEYEDDEDEE